jgi:hypothetical protein
MTTTPDDHHNQQSGIVGDNYVASLSNTGPACGRPVGCDGGAGGPLSAR